MTNLFNEAESLDRTGFFGDSPSEPIKRALLEIERDGLGLMSTIFWLKTLTARFENRPDYLKCVLSQVTYLLYIRFQRLLDFKAYRKDWSLIQKPKL